ncbi:DUF6930 domain-containing protein [Sporolactobacillus terrae]|uniref:DUF7309 domain-containing protein n=1 Tax=Sporolactobacillus terrae TaxID=269673 RepID=UPI00048D571D|nr:hypothetical protein [Sporolactobacillus terrae]
MNIQLKISIKGSKPPVWMRLQADSMVTVGELHAYINDVISYLHEDAIIELPKRLGYSVDSEKVTVAFVSFGQEEDPLYEAHSGIFNEDTSFVSDYLIEPGDKGRCFLPDRPEQIEILLEPLKSPVDDRLPCCIKCGKGMITFFNDQLVTDDPDEEPILDQHDAVNEVNELLSIYRRRQEQEPLPFSFKSEWQSAWRMLLDAAEMYAAHEPWHWLNSDQIFALELPDDSRRYYCSVLGANADEFGLAIYVGDQGLAMLEQMFSGTMRTPETAPAQLFSLSLCRYGTFPDEDRLLLDELGADLEARKCWPMLRVKSPGYQAWIPQGEEITRFTELIRKVTAIAWDHQKQPDDVPFYQEGALLLRKYGRDASGAESWEEEQIQPNAEMDGSLLKQNAPLYPNQVDLQRLKKKARQNRSWVEMDGNYTPFSIPSTNDDPRPTLPWLQLAVDHFTGQVLLHDLASPDQCLTTEEFARTAQQFLVTLIQETGQRPSGILISNQELYYALVSLCRKLGIICSKSDELPKLSETREAMFAAMSRQR